MAEFLNTPVILVIRSIIDILSVAYLIYFLYSLFRDTNSITIIKGFLFIIAIYTVAALIGLETLAWTFQYVVTSFVIIVVILFQPELRRLLSRMGRSGFSAIRQKFSQETVQEIARACYLLSEEKTGALIILEQNVGLHDLLEDAVRLDASVQAELIQTIFFHNSPLHDGAILIENERITAARVIIPHLLLDNVSAVRRKKPLGTRHRAALAITTDSDAVGIVVSEETGNVSISYNGKLEYDLGKERFIKRMEEILGSH